MKEDKCCPLMDNPDSESDTVSVWENFKRSSSDCCARLVRIHMRKYPLCHQLPHTLLAGRDIVAVGHVGCDQ